MAQKKTGGTSKCAARKTVSTAKGKTSGSSAKRKTSSTAPKQTTLSTVAKVSDFSGMHSVTVTQKNITVNGKKRFPNNRQNSEVAVRELKKRGVKSVTYRV